MNRWVEAVAAGAAGTALGWVTGISLDIALWTAVAAGANGLISGARGIYDWRRPAGWGGFVLDSTWGLIGTAGAVLVHGLQAVLPSGRYRPDLSHRRGRHVYEGGYRLKPTYATAIGNLVTNAGGTVGLDGPAGPRRRLLIDRHEMLHIWQYRWLGPVFPALYLLWAGLGAIFGLVIGLVTRRPVGKSVLTIAYFNNPFEYWAYRRDRYWPPAGADSTLTWPGKAEDPRRDRLV